MDNQEYFLLVVIYILYVHIDEILIPILSELDLGPQGHGKLDLKVVEGWAIAIENRHIEVWKGSVTGFFLSLHTSKAFLSQTSSQTGS